MKLTDHFNVLLKDTDNGNGTHTYEYAIHNLNSHRSACAFDVNLQPGSSARIVPPGHPP